MPAAPPARLRPVLYARGTKPVQADIAQGVVFLIKTGADGSGPVDIHLDENVTPAQFAQFRVVGQEHLLVLASGQLGVDGMEHYRAEDNQLAPANVLAVPPGDYGITCLVNTDEESASGAPTEEALRSALGADDLRYYRTAARRTQLGCVAVFLFPLLWPFVGWKLSLVCGLILMIGWTHAREWWLKRDARYQAIHGKYLKLMKSSADEGPATVVLILRRLASPAGLTGGSVHFDARP
jgi:hypothetical protein